MKFILIATLTILSTAHASVIVPRKCNKNDLATLKELRLSDSEFIEAHLKEEILPHLSTCKISVFPRPMSPAVCGYSSKDRALYELETTDKHTIKLDISKSYITCYLERPIDYDLDYFEIKKYIKY